MVTPRIAQEQYQSLVSTIRQGADLSRCATWGQLYERVAALVNETHLTPLLERVSALEDEIARLKTEPYSARLLRWMDGAATDQA